MSEGVACGGLVRRQTKRKNIYGIGNSVGLPVDIERVSPTKGGDVMV